MHQVTRQFIDEADLVGVVGFLYLSFTDHADGSLLKQDPEQVFTRVYTLLGDNLAPRRYELQLRKALNLLDEVRKDVELRNEAVTACLEFLEIHPDFTGTDQFKLLTDMADYATKEDAIDDREKQWLAKMAEYWGIMEDFRRLQ